LCPARLRPAVAAIYWFARTADDLADEGEVSAAKRLQDLALYRADLLRLVDGQRHSGRWPQVFDSLAQTLAQFDLPISLLLDLLDAFVQDVTKTRDSAGYANQQALLDYCSRSANPVGRLLLHLYGLRDPQSLHNSDTICSALQLINFWQDLSRDIPRTRYYLPEHDCLAHGVDRDDLLRQRQTPAVTDLIAHQCRVARSMMASGATLVHDVPGRAGWELRMVVQGGLRILDKIAAMNYATLLARPTLKPWDFPIMLWRACWMRKATATVQRPS
jgi:squalene synthase HpnC